VQHPSTSRSSTSLVCALTLALGAETAALLLFAADQVIVALAWHTIAALSCAFAGNRAANGTPEARPELAAIVTASLAFTLPGIGLLGLVWVVIPHMASARRAVPDHVLELELPAFHRHESVALDTERGFAAIEDELAPERPIEQRIRSVMALRRMDPKRAVPLLRIALGDRSEDVRLLAYAILERREKHIRARITHALSELREEVGGDVSQTDSARVTRLRGLANDHWELVYAELSEGDGQKLNLEQAARWAEAALRVQFDGTTALLLARVRLKQYAAEDAWQLIVAAERAGVAPGVCAPLMAEAAFLMRKFDAIPRLLARVADDPMHPARLEPVARFWTARSAT
jgi:polysaccharide biosynthesis protein PelE